MTTPLAAFVEFLFHLFVLLLDLTVDGFCFCFLLCACAQPWRLPKVCRGACLNDDWFDTRAHFRSTCISQFFFGLADAVTGMAFVFVLCSGLRTCNLCHKINSKGRSDTNSYRKTQFSMPWASTTWSQVICSCDLP